MPVTRADLQGAIDTALANRVGLMFGVLFDGMFSGRKDHAEALKRFREGVADHLQAHAAASGVISEISTGEPQS